MLLKVPGSGQTTHTLLESPSSLRMYGARAVGAGVLILLWTVHRALLSGPPKSTLFLSRFLAVTFLYDGEQVFFSDSHNEKRSRLNYLIFNPIQDLKRNVA